MTGEVDQLKQLYILMVERINQLDEKIIDVSRTDRGAIIVLFCTVISLMVFIGIIHWGKI